jgi:CMP-2-keto-3-deoxyoctulosonic acid synthetase
MKVVGFVAAKENSNRLPNKNIMEIKGKPLFFHAVETLLEAKRVDDVYVATDSTLIKKYCDYKNVNVIWRHPAAKEDEEPIFDVWKYMYKTLPNKYDVIVGVLGNTIGHRAEDVDRGLRLLQDQGLREVRSFNIGVENGIVILRSDTLMTRYQISIYQGSIQSDAIEIHTEEDLKNV